MEKIILLGSGGHCISCIDVIESTAAYEIAGILDKPDLVGKQVYGYPVIGTDEEIPRLAAEGYSFLITVGQIKNPLIRIKLFQTLKSLNARLPVIISKHAYVSKHAILGEGAIVMHHALINSEVTIGSCAIINSKALIEHESHIGDFCHISTGSILNGQVKIGSRCFIGSNSVVNNNIEICDDVILASLSSVSVNLRKGGIYKGNKLIK